jgi:aldehyde dehydrogenase (NAD+)
MAGTSFDYAPAPESRAIVDLQPFYGLFIGGEFVDPVDGTSFKTVSPATEEVLAEVSEAGPADVDMAVAAARRAYDTVWSRLPARERGKYLFRIARILQERSRELAVLESLDNGKPIREARDVDIPLVAAWFFHYAGWADKLDHAGFGPARGRWAWRGRSSRGTSRCSCSRGRSPLRWHAATRWCSSRPKPRH